MRIGTYNLPSGLAVGDHQVVALVKANGYYNSEESAKVVYTVSPETLVEISNDFRLFNDTISPLPSACEYSMAFKDQLGNQYSSIKFTSNSIMFDDVVVYSNTWRDAAFQTIEILAQKISSDLYDIIDEISTIIYFGNTLNISNRSFAYFPINEGADILVDIPFWGGKNCGKLLISNMGGTTKIFYFTDEEFENKVYPYAANMAYDGKYWYKPQTIGIKNSTSISDIANNFMEKYSWTRDYGTYGLRYDTNYYCGGFEDGTDLPKEIIIASAIYLDDGSYKNVKGVAYGAFQDIDNISSVQILIDVDAESYLIGDFAFRRCKNLTSVTIPKGVTEIKGYAFANIGNLTINYGGSSTEWANVTKADDWDFNTTITMNYNT